MNKSHFFFLKGSLYSEFILHSPGKSRLNLLPREGGRETWEQRALQARGCSKPSKVRHSAGRAAEERPVLKQYQMHSYGNLTEEKGKEPFSEFTR